MHNTINDISTTVDSIHQINSIGMTSEVMILTILSFCVISFVVSKILNLFLVYKKINKIIDERIDSRMKSFIELTTESAKTIKKLEKNTAEMNATLSIIRQVFINYISLDKKE